MRNNGQQNATYDVLTVASLQHSRSLLLRWRGAYPDVCRSVSPAMLEQQLWGPALVWTRAALPSKSCHDIIMHSMEACQSVTFTRVIAPEVRHSCRPRSTSACIGVHEVHMPVYGCGRYDQCNSQYVLFVVSYRRSTLTAKIPRRPSSLCCVDLVCRSELFQDQPCPGMFTL